MTQIAAPELRSLLDAVNAAGDAEAALSRIGHAALAALGDKAAGSRPGALKPGETERTIFGFLLVKPKRDGLMLFAEHGWPAEQHRASIAIDNGRPGWVVAHGKAAALPNTDEDAIFTQILSSARMGSTIYAPLIWRGETIGLITLASQARYTYSAAEIPALEALAGIAALAWVAHGGPALLARECGG